MARKKRHSKKNHLLKAMKVRELYMKYKYVNGIDSGLSNRFIFQNYIFPVYPMTERTFYNFLDINPFMELKKLEEIEKSQLKLEL